MSRYTPHVTIRRSSPNRYPGRSGKPTLIVIHSTESDQVKGSSRDLANVADYLCRPSTKASANVITDGDGHSARLVSDGDRAWAQAAFNGVALSIEQIGRASQTFWARDEVRETARWVARWHHLHGIPIRVGAVSGSSVVRPGVVTHHMLGAAGGGHVDPGSSYPLEAMLRLARWYATKL